MSVRGTIVIADLARDAARVGLAALGDQSVEVPAEFALPQRVALVLGDAGIVALAGGAAAGARTDAHTLVFNRLQKSLPRVGDSELRSRLAAANWGALCEELTGRGLVGPEGCVGYVIPHHLSTQPLLEEFRAACAASSVRPVGFVHEAAALALGFVRSPLLTKTLDGGGGRATFCLLVASDESEVDVVCFDYSAEHPPRRELLIRDFFHADCAGLSKSLEGRSWAAGITHLVSVEDEAVEAESLAPLVALFKADGARVEKRRFKASAARRLKIGGAAHVARCCHGRGGAGEEYSISNAYGIGVQTDRKRFHPIIDGLTASAVEDFPRRAEQTFALRGQPGAQLRLDLRCGYSDRVAETIPLGVATVGVSDLARRAGRGEAVNVAVTLDAPGAGQFTLESATTRRPLASLPFVLPSLVS